MVKSFIFMQLHNFNRQVVDAMNFRSNYFITVLASLNAFSYLLYAHYSFLTNTLSYKV